MFFRVAAFDHISTKLCGRLESFLYNEKLEKEKQENKREMERKNVERMQKEDFQANQIADYEEKMQEMITGYDFLQSEFDFAQKKLESLKVIFINCYFFAMFRYLTIVSFIVL